MSLTELALVLTVKALVVATQFVAPGLPTPPLMNRKPLLVFTSDGVVLMGAPTPVELPFELEIPKKPPRALLPPACESMAAELQDPTHESLAGTLFAVKVLAKISR